MKLGIIAGYSPATMSVPMELIKEAEGLGYDSVWTADCLLYTSPSPRDGLLSRMPSSA